LHQIVTLLGRAFPCVLRTRKFLSKEKNLRTITCALYCVTDSVLLKCKKCKQYLSVSRRLVLSKTRRGTAKSASQSPLHARNIHAEFMTCKYRFTCDSLSTKYETCRKSSRSVNLASESIAENRLSQTDLSVSRRLMKHASERTRGSVRVERAHAHAILCHDISGLCTDIKG
jgi:hypothetical protein